MFRLVANDRTSVCAGAQQAQHKDMTEDALARRVALLEETILSQDMALKELQTAQAKASALQALLRDKESELEAMEVLLDEARANADRWKSRALAAEKALKPPAAHTAAFPETPPRSSAGQDANVATPVVAAAVPTRSPLRKAALGAATPVAALPPALSSAAELELRVLELGEANAKLLREVADARELLDVSRPVRALSEPDMSPAPLLSDQLGALSLKAPPPAGPATDLTADVYYVHFYLLVMGEKARKSALSSSFEAIECLNQLDQHMARALYEKCIGRNVPPEHWPAFIREEVARLTSVSNGSGARSDHPTHMVHNMVSSIAGALQDVGSDAPQRRRRLGSSVTPPPV
jgi:hypothetical protein